jgi:hypothetical protein
MFDAMMIINTCGNKLGQDKVSVNCVGKSRYCVILISVSGVVLTLLLPLSYI